MNSYTPRTIPCLVYGSSEEETQVVNVSYLVRRQSAGWYVNEPPMCYIQYCEVVDQLNFQPSDIETDVHVAVTEYERGFVQFEGEIKYRVVELTNA